MKRYHFFIAIMAMLTISCSKGNNKNGLTADDIELDQTSAKQEEKNPSPTDTADTAYSNVLQAGQPKLPDDWDKKIIKTANVSIELKDFNAYNTMIHQATRRYGAYIAAEQQSQQYDRLENNISIRVPVEQFEDLMNALPVQDAKIMEKQISTEDVTGEVVDTKARTEAKKQVRERYMGLLKQAKNMKDILEVEKEINGIQQEIEAGAGRVGYLVHQASYSTINLKYYQLLADAPKPDEAPTFFTKVSNAFANGTSIITGIVVLAITFWPLILGGLLTWYVVKRLMPKPVKPVTKAGE